MKKLLSLVFGLAMLAAFTAPATAAIKFSGDAQVRARGEFVRDTGLSAYTSCSKSMSVCDPSGEEWNEEMYWLYRLRLKVAADLGSGYFAKALLASESAGWFATITERTGFPDNLADHFGVNQMYFGRMMQDSHYMVGLMPVNSFNNPIFDLAVYPSAPLGVPYFLLNNDRIFGLNYGRKIGQGELNATLCVLGDKQWDNTDESFFRDEYALHLMYRTNIGDIIVDPQLLAAVTRTQGGCDYWWEYCDEEKGYAPFTFGTNVIIPSNGSTFTFSAFYTMDGIGIIDDDNSADYHGYLLRAKYQHGPIRAWVDYNSTEDNSNNDEYSNLFVWAQYNWKVYDSSMGTLTLSPTLRYLDKDLNDGEYEYTRWRPELWANITF